MTSTTTLALVLSVALMAVAGPGMADNKKQAKTNGKAYVVPPGKVKGTPPGLAKKPGGMPPGQYKKIYRKGDKLSGDYVWIDDYDRWRLPPLMPGQGYVRYDNEVYRAARDTAIVIEAIGIVSDLLR